MMAETREKPLPDWFIPATNILHLLHQILDLIDAMIYDLVRTRA